MLLTILIQIQAFVAYNLISTCLLSISLKYISTTLYPAHSRVGGGNLVLRCSVPHFPLNSGGIACWVVELNAVLHLWMYAVFYNVWPPIANMMFSKATQLINAHGPSRIHRGRKPLYNENMPSFFTDCWRQSIMPRYNVPLETKESNLV